VPALDLEKILRGLDVDELLGKYDEAAQELLEVARRDGHFSAPQEWPSRGTQAAPITVDDLQRRATLITTIHDGIPPRRDARLAEAYEKYVQAMPVYHQANRLFLHLRRQFLERGAGDERDFLQLYQSVYLEALDREDPVHLDSGEAALVQLRVARVPLSHAQSVAEKLQTPPTDDDPRWSATYACTIDGRERSGSLRHLLRHIAECVVDFLAAGEHLAIRYNTFNNFVWLGISVWKAITDADLLLARLRGSVRQKWRDELSKVGLVGKAMLLKFLQAHLEDPAQIKPREYWYGQEYSYLTRDMIDLTCQLVRHVNRLAARARGVGAPPLDLPPLLRNQVRGRFLEHPHVGRSEQLSTWRRRVRLLRWARLFRQIGARKQGLRDLEPAARLRQAWQQTGEWARRTLEIFDVQVEVRIDPLFASVAADLELHRPDRKILFLPTHQSIFDHPVMNWVLQSPALMDAMGWQEPVPCAMLARARLTEPTMLRIGPWQFSLIGLTPEEVDRILVDVDGHVIMQRTRDTGNPTQRFAKLLEERPGVVYGAGTAAAFELQCLPMQHGLFAQLPPDIILIPVAFRGIHSVWPKCPKGNLHINPGRVEVVVCPPMLGETTLLPRKRSLRTQLEPATLFQAVHIASLFDPEPGENHLPEKPS